MLAIIKDVATPAGVSPSTVSRICRGHPSISRRIEEKIRQAVVELGYELNFQANSLVTQNSHIAGIILPPSEWEAYQDPLYLEMTWGISQYCSQKQYINTVIMGQNKDEVLQAIKTMARIGLAGRFTAPYSREQDPVLGYLCEEGLLYVLIRRACRSVNQTIYVDNDNVLTDREVAEYLLNLGHVRTARLSGDRLLLHNHNRKMGYMPALAERGISFGGQLCVEMSPVPEEQDQALEVLFARKNRPTAAPISDDILAMALEKACIGLGLSIPGDVSTLPFNNSLLSRLAFPPSTSMDVNAYQLGIETAVQTISHMENPEPVVMKIIVPHHLVERESCAGTGRSCGDWDTETI